MEKEVAIIGLGKMGANTARNLSKQDYHVVGYDQNINAMYGLSGEKVITPAYGLEEIPELLESKPRTVWLSLPKGEPIDETVDELTHLLEPGDTVIDAANAYWKNSQKRYERLQECDINFLDAGCSGGPEGALNGMSIMVGGDQDVFNHVEQLFADLSASNHYAYMGETGMGHLTKAVHNGIEYGMMQAIAEGLSTLKKHGVNPETAAEAWGDGCVIRSDLVDHTLDAFKEFGADLEDVSGRVPQGGTGKWAQEAAEERGVDTPVLDAAIHARKESWTHPTYTSKIVRAQRHSFGGHAVKDPEETGEE